MEYTKERIEGNIMQLILDKVNAVTEPFEEDLGYYLNDLEGNKDIIAMKIKCLQEVREETFAKYGVKPQRLGEIKGNEL